MEPEEHDDNDRQWIPFVASIVLKLPLLFIGIGFALGYYLHAIFGFARYLQILIYSIPVFAACLFGVQPAVDRFYEDIKDQYKNDYWITSIKVPPTAIFYRTITSDIGTRRKLYGYLYVIVQTLNFILFGFVISAILGRGTLSPFWRGL